MFRAVDPRLNRAVIKVLPSSVAIDLRFASASVARQAGAAPRTPHLHASRRRPRRCRLPCHGMSGRETLAACLEGSSPTSGAPVAPSRSRALITLTGTASFTAI